MLPNLAAWLSHRLPSQCLACHRWGPGGPLCPACMQRFAPAPERPRCSGCGQPWPASLWPEPPLRCGACLRQPPPWQHCHVWVDYGYPWADLIARWKLQQHPALAAHLARWLLSSPHLAQALQQADVLLPLPLSPQRLRERGFNQAAQLTQHWARHFAQHPQGGPHARTDLLLRPQHQRTQRTLGRSARLRNLQGAFTVRSGADLAGLRLLVVDDVITTGATLRAACTALQAAGAQHISVLAVARTP